MPSANRHFDVAIVGAGPAGTHLAARLARAGVWVALFDPKAPWEKPCGGGITHKAWSRFPILRDPGLPRNEVLRSLQISPGRRFFVINEGHPLLMVSRRDLGELMLNNAVDAGADFLPLRVDEVDLDHGRVRLRAGGDAFFADFVVGADGVRSIVREAFLGPLPKERTLGAIYQFYEGGPPDPTVVRVTPFPGYCWSFPRRDCLGVGAGALQPGFDLKGSLQQFTRDLFPGRRPLGPPRGALLPYINGLDAYREPRVGRWWAAIGDAGGFIDTLTGEGIIYAVWSADLLADACLGGRPHKYEAAWRREFGWHLLTGSFVARRIFTPGAIDRFFAAITVCPALRGVFMDYIWNLPPYPRLLVKALAALPTTIVQWRRFMERDGGQIDPAALGPFQDLAGQVDLRARS
jgi:flavin-dependent dehydrogenase